MIFRLYNSDNIVLTKYIFFQLHINNQIIVINGMLMEHTDEISEKLYDKQKKALNNMPHFTAINKMYYVPLRAYNIMGTTHIRSLLKNDDITSDNQIFSGISLPHLQKVIDDLYLSKKLQYHLSSRHSLYFLLHLVRVRLYGYHLRLQLRQK